MKKRKVTINDIQENLFDLDTEYREALAETLMKLKYISDSPINLQYGTKEQQRELQEVWNKELQPKQIIEIINYMKKLMKTDFQYESFKEIAEMYLNIAKENETQQKEKKNKQCDKNTR